jgi:hypothetical protein
VPLAFPIKHTQGSTLFGNNHLFTTLDPQVVFNVHVKVIAHVDARHAVPDSWRGLSQASEYK